MLVPVKPLVHWYVTTRCNSRCNTCSIWKDPRYKVRESTLESRVALLPELKRMGFLSIDFTGGEPLLYPGLPRLIRRARQMGFLTWLTTNSLLYPRHAIELRGQVSALSFSLDSPIQEKNDAIRGISHYKKAILAIKLALSLGETPMIKATVCKENVDDLKGFASLAAKLGVLVEFNAEFSYFSNPALDKHGIEKILELSRHPNVIVSRPHLNFMKNGGNDVNRPKCHIGRNMIVIAPDNSLYYPCMHLSRETIPLVNGSVRETLKVMKEKGLIDNVGKLPECKGCTIPCYIEPSYYTEIDRYFLQCLVGRVEYLVKRLRLSISNRLRS